MNLKRIIFAIACIACCISQPCARAMGSEEATKIITAAYEDLLGRKPDDAGLAALRTKMVDEGWKEEKVRDTIKQSDEYQQTRVTRIIETAYQDILGRKPDDEGRKLYTDKILKEEWSEKDVRNALKKSKEYKDKHKKDK